MKDLNLVATNNFDGILCDLYEENDSFYMTRKQIGQALGYEDPQKAVDKIHDRHKERLDAMSVTTSLGATDGKYYKTRLYNERGIMEICRWSRQPKADLFMDWVWDLVQLYRRNKKLVPARQEAITPVERFLDSMQELMEEIRETNTQLCQTNRLLHEDNKTLKETLLQVLESQASRVKTLEQSETVTKEGVLSNFYEKSNTEKEAVKDRKPTAEEEKFNSWKKEVDNRVTWVVKNGKRFSNNREVLGYCYNKMKISYGIVWEQSTKEYKRDYSIETGTWVKRIEVIYHTPLLLDLFESILNGVVEKTKKENSKQKDQIHRDEIWKTYSLKIVELCKKIGNHSRGGGSFYRTIFMKMDVDWSIYEKEIQASSKKNVIRKYDNLLNEFTKVADKQLKEVEQKWKIQSK